MMNYQEFMSDVVGALGDMLNIRWWFDPNREILCARITNRTDIAIFISEKKIIKIAVSADNGCTAAYVYRDSKKIPLNQQGDPGRQEIIESTYEVLFSYLMEKSVRT